MPTMGKPLTAEEMRYRNVRMGAEARVKNLSKEQIEQKQKEKLLNKLTGFKPDNKLYVDGKTHNKMGKDEFLKLLTVQLKNQDPMKPMEQNKMAAELAQFSQLEQLSNLNTKFDSLVDDKGVKDKFYGASFLGKEVVTTGSSLEFSGKEGESADILYHLPKPAEKVLVRVFDDKNNMISEEWKENIGRGNQTFTWDGQSLDGATAIAGTYKTQVYAWDESSEPIIVKTKNTGIVESVFFENGETVLKVDGKKVFLRDVDSFHTPNPQGPEATLGQNQANLKEAFNNSSNLPIAQETGKSLNLNSKNNKASVDAYKKHHVPTTGLTNVYDVE